MTLKEARTIKRALLRERSERFYQVNIFKISHGDVPESLDQEIDYLDTLISKYSEIEKGGGG